MGFHRPSNISSVLTLLGISIHHIIPTIPDLPIWGSQLMLAVSNAFLLTALLLSQKNADDPYMADIENVPTNTPALMPQTVYPPIFNPLPDPLSIPTQPSSVINTNGGH